MKAWLIVCVLALGSGLPATARAGEDPEAAAVEPPAVMPAASVSAAAPAPVPAAEVADRPYRLGPGDVLAISVWKDESLSREVVVPPDGVLAFPLTGDLRAEGLTVAEVREKLKARLGPYVPDAPITVILNRAESMTASVIGKVNHPGQFPINQQSRVIQLLAVAGGVTPYASESKILVLRQKGNTTVKLPFDYSQVKAGKDLDQNVLLERGDVVVVP